MGDGEVAQPIAGVRGVGNQLAQEHRPVAVERMGNDIEQSADLGLKAVLFFLHRRHACTLFLAVSCPNPCRI